MQRRLANKEAAENVETTQKRKVSSDLGEKTFCSPLVRLDDSQITKKKYQRVIVDDDDEEEEEEEEDRRVMVHDEEEEEEEGEEEEQVVSLSERIL